MDKKIIAILRKICLLYWSYTNSRQETYTWKCCKKTLWSQHWHVKNSHFSIISFVLGVTLFAAIICLTTVPMLCKLHMNIRLYFLVLFSCFFDGVISKICLSTGLLLRIVSITLGFISPFALSWYFDNVKDVVANICFTTVPWLIILHIDIIFIFSHLFTVATLIVWKESLPTLSSLPFPS